MLKFIDITGIHGNGMRDVGVVFKQTWMVWYYLPLFKRIVLDMLNSTPAPTKASNTTVDRRLPVYGPEITSAFFGPFPTIF